MLLRSSVCRYEGFEQSLESAAANIAEGEGKLKKRGAVPANSQAPVRSKGSHFRDNLRLVSEFAWLCVSAAWTLAAGKRPRLVRCRA